jgi:hypothetical protein
MRHDLPVDQARVVPMTTCPYCRSDVHPQALVCPHCTRNIQVIKDLTSPLKPGYVVSMIGGLILLVVYMFVFHADWLLKH